MSKFIRSIGRASYNNCGLDIYENRNGSATIRPTICGRDKPQKFWRSFENLEALEAWIVDRNQNELSGVHLVASLLSDVFFMSGSEYALHSEREWVANQ